MDATESVQNRIEQMGKHQSALPHGHKLEALICSEEEGNRVIDLQRQWSLKFDFKEILKLHCESHRTQGSDALSLCDTNYIYLGNTRRQERSKFDPKANPEVCLCFKNFCI